MAKNILAPKSPKPKTIKQKKESMAQNMNPVSVLEASRPDLVSMLGKNNNL